MGWGGRHRASRPLPPQRHCLTGNQSAFLGQGQPPTGRQGQQGRQGSAGSGWTIPLLSPAILVRQRPGCRDRWSKIPGKELTSFWPGQRCSQEGPCMYLSGRRGDNGKERERKLSPSAPKGALCHVPRGMGNRGAPCLHVKAQEASWPASTTTLLRAHRATASLLGPK